MESEVLANMLAELYEKYEIEASDLSKENAEIRQIAMDSQLKIGHAMQHWINTFPFHFALDARLFDVIRAFTDLIESKGHQEHLQFLDMSNM